VAGVNLEKTFVIEAITEALQDEIDAQTSDAPTRKRLSACLPMLGQALADWQANHAFSAPGLMIAAATQRCGIVVHANAWSALACESDLATSALAEASELPTSPEAARLVTATLGTVLGESGRRAQDRDAAAISRFEDMPLLVAIVDPPVVLATTVPVERPAEPSAMIH
jgi:hypothetical protein